MQRLVFCFYFIVQFTSLYGVLQQSNTLLARYEYLGCFVDQIGQRDLNLFIGDYPQLTVEQCIRACQAEHQLFAAIQYGTECRCGNQYGQYGQASDEQCSYRCSTEENCGGDYRNSVYRAVPLSDPAMTCKKDRIAYQGCFPSTTLPVLMGRVTSIDQCVQDCSTNYQYAGILDGHFCQCGNDLSQPALSSSLCRVPCATDQTESDKGCCGGRDVLSIYNVKYYQSPPSTDDSPETNIRVKRADAVSGTTYMMSMGPSASSTAMTSSSTGIASTVTNPMASLPMTSTVIDSRSSALPLASSSITTNPFIPVTTPTTNYSPTGTSSGSNALLLASSSVTTNPAIPVTTPTANYSSTGTSSGSSLTMSGSSAGSQITTAPTGASSPASTTLLSSVASNPTFVASSPGSTVASSMGSIAGQPSSQTEMSSTGSSARIATAQSTISGSIGMNSLSSGIPMTNTMTNLSPLSTASMLTVQSLGTGSTSPTLSNSVTSSRNNLTSLSLALTQSSPQIMNPTSLTPTNSSSSLAVGTSSAGTGNVTVTSITVNNNTTAPAVVTGAQTTGSFTSNAVVTTVSVVIPPASIISTVLLVPIDQLFSPTSDTTRESVRRALSNVINLAFRCLNNASSPNCTQTSRRSKRQTCSSGYLVTLVSDITQLASTSAERRYNVDYIVNDLCNPSTLVSPDLVRTASGSLTRERISQLLGFQYEGDFARISTATTTAATPDRKLWLIGATLGPVAFVFLLIFVCCFLHYKCRPRTTSKPVTKATDAPPPVSARSTTYQNFHNEPVQERPLADRNLHFLTQHDPLVGNQSAPKRVIPKEFLKDSNTISPMAADTEIPMDELRRQSEVERWRNKIRLQEKYQQSPLDHRLSSESHTDGSTAPYDPLRFNMQPAADIKLKPPPRSIPETTDVYAGRTKLHRLLDEVIDQAKTEDRYDPDSDHERLKRRRQRRRTQSNSDESHYSPIQHDLQQKPHIPVVAQVSQRPDPTIVRLRYNPYEAGDRTHAMSNFAPVELRPKFSYDDSDVTPRYSRSSYRSNPALFFDDSTIADRAATATNAYGSPKRRPRSRLESDQEAAMRHDGGHADRRSHVFHDGGVYVDSISKSHGQPRAGWIDPAEAKSDYRDEYLTAKRSVVNTRNIISSIHNELQNIVFPASENYQA